MTLTKERLAAWILELNIPMSQAETEDAVRVITDGFLSIGECPGSSIFVYAKADDKWIEQQQLAAKVRLEPLDFDFCGPLENRLSAEGYWSAFVDWALAATPPHPGFGASVSLFGTIAYLLDGGEK